MPTEHDAGVTGQDVTKLLHAWGAGDVRAAGRLTEIIYAQVRAMAGKHLRRNAASVTLQATELAHEMFVRLLQAEVAWRDRRHFYGVVSAALRNILIDAARARGSEKRGGGQVHVTLSSAGEISAADADASGLEEALQALHVLDARKHDIVQFHYLLGLKREEIAEVLAISVPTVDRDLRFAKAWLRERLHP